MTDWTKIHKDFTPELKEKWKNFGFTFQQTKKWIKIGGLWSNDYDCYLAAYARYRNYQPEQIKKRRWLMEEYERWTKKNSAQVCLDALYSQSQKEKITNLDINHQHLVGKLDFSDFPNLKELDCSSNKLTDLDLSQNQELKTLNCRFNKFTSLAFTKPLTKLEELYVDGVGNDIISGLECLPLSLKNFQCNYEIKNELVLYGSNLALWQELHPELMKQVGKEPVINSYNDDSLQVFTATPRDLAKKLTKESIITTSYDLSPFNYTDFILRDSRPLVWKIDNANSLEKDDSSFSITKLPLRLYNLQVQEVETTKNKKDIQDYLILSYCWGTDWEKQPQTYGQSYPTDLTKLGRKALNKVIKTWELINQKSQTSINHIWIDNFCINQSDPEEKGQEVAKQKQYYSNASVTLIAIDGEIGKVDKKNEVKLAKHILEQIVNSPWFKRSWTFQEGLLSKQTIFMFDDGLVDGRVLARIWAGMQEKRGRGLYRLTSPAIFVTPLGWSYGSNPEQAINLGLNEALLAVKHRSQTVPVDGIYSILGLLPYGEKVKTKYKSKICQHSEKEQKDTNICPHNETEKQWPTYSKEELEQRLIEVVKTAVENGYSGEVLSWEGKRLNEAELWWIPTVNKNGSTSITDLIEIAVESNDLEVTAQGIKLVGKWDNYFKEVRLNHELTKYNDGSCIYISIKDNSSVKIGRIGNGGKVEAKNPIFIDMVNKIKIRGEEAIQAYQEKLSNTQLQEKQEKQFQKEEQLITPTDYGGLWTRRTTYNEWWSSLSPYNRDKIQTFDDKNIYSSEITWDRGKSASTPTYYYIFKNNIAYQIVKSKKDNWKYLIAEPQLQAQQEQLPK